MINKERAEALLKRQPIFFEWLMKEALRELGANGGRECRPHEHVSMSSFSKFHEKVMEKELYDKSKGSFEEFLEELANYIKIA